MKFWKRWFNPDPKPADPLSRGMAALAAGEAPGERSARELLATVAGTDPRNGEAQLALGMLRLSEFRREAAPATLHEAVTYLSRAAELLPESPEAHFYLALGESFALDTIDAADAHLATALRLDPALDARAGEIRERIAGARTGLQQQALDPQTVHAAVQHYEAAQALLDAERPAEAVERLDAAVKLYPAYVEALLALGDAYRRLGRTDDAIAALRRALAVRPQLFQAQVALGSLYVAAGDHARALDQLRLALGQQPDHAQVLRSVGLLELRTGQPRDASTTFRRLCALQPDDPEPRLQLALALLQAGDQAGARDALARLFDAALQPRQRETAARIARDLGDPELEQRFTPPA